MIKKSPLEVNYFKLKSNPDTISSYSLLLIFMSSTQIIDTLINQLDSALRTLLPSGERAGSRPSPAETVPEAALSLNEKKQIAGLMRVNHSGEVCAQALYQGQALTAKLTHIKDQMNQAALEEIDHLAWCEKRLQELGSHTSILNPLWYGGSLFIGALAGLAGDKVSLGFVAETERQVTAHLQSHLKKLPEQDQKSKTVLQVMKQDEEHHATLAVESGAMELPLPVKKIMSLVSKLMTKSSYYV